MSALGTPQADWSDRLAASLRRRRRNLYAVLAIFAVVTLVAGSVVLWRTAREAGSREAAPPADEYVIYFAEDLPLPAQEAVLHRYPFVASARPGKLPGVMVVQLCGDAAGNARRLREDPHILQILKSTAGMLCH